jgi:anti-sigma factor RsiW
MSRPSCLAEADLLSAALDESLTAAARRHLSACVFCGRRLRRLRAELAALRRLAEPAPPSPAPLCRTEPVD